MAKQKQLFTRSEVEDYAKTVRFLASKLDECVAKFRDTKVDSVEFFGGSMAHGIKFIEQFCRNCDFALNEVAFWTGHPTQQKTKPDSFTKEVQQLEQEGLGPNSNDKPKINPPASHSKGDKSLPRKKINGK